MRTKSLPTRPARSLEPAVGPEVETVETVETATIREISQRPPTPTRTP
jgi:hypothetical protein